MHCANPNATPKMSSVRPWVIAFGLVILVLHGRTRIQVISTTTAKPPKFTFDWNSVTGYHTWAKNYPQCATPYQYPINVAYNVSTIVRHKWTDYYKSVGFYVVQGRPVLMNTGGGVRSMLLGGKWLITGSHFGTTIYTPTVAYYEFSQTPHRGAMHNLEGKNYSMECDQVMVRYGRPKEDNAPDIISLTTMYNEVEEDNPKLVELIDALKCVTYKDQRVRMRTFKFRKWLPNNMDETWAYVGSYGYPPCTKTNWLVNRQVVNISHRQMNVFRSLREGTAREAAMGVPMRGIIADGRPIQPLRGRVLELHQRIASDAARLMDNVVMTLSSLALLVKLSYSHM